LLSILSMNENMQPSKPFLEDGVAKKHRRSLLISGGVLALACIAAIFLQMTVAQLNEEIQKSNDTIVVTNKNIATLKSQSGVVAYQVLAGAKKDIVAQIENSQIQGAIREMKKISQNAQFNMAFEGFSYTKGIISTRAIFTVNQEGTISAVEYARRFIEYFRNNGSPVFTLGKITSISGDEKVRSFNLEFKWAGVNPTETTK